MSVIIVIHSLTQAVHDRLLTRRIVTWVLLDGSRWLLSALVLIGFFFTLVVLGSLGPVSLAEAVAAGDPIDTTFQALITAIITGVTIVVTINQLVLSQELGAVGDQRERMEGAMSFRRDVEPLLDQSTSPTDPSSFLKALLAAARHRTTTVRERLPEGGDQSFRNEVQEYDRRLRQSADAVEKQLEDAQFGTFELVQAALGFDYSRWLHEARRLREENEAELTDDLEAAFDTLVAVLEFFGAAREHFKTLYFQWELINLSRVVSYTAPPALVVAVAMLFFVDLSGWFEGTTLAVDNLVWITSGAVTVAVSPFVFLLAYIVRIGTVAKRTLAIGPFVLQDVDTTDRTNGF